MPRLAKKTEIKKSHKAATFQTVKGMVDILPKEQDWWKAVWQVANNVAELHDFHFIETPILETAALFESGTGVVTDIVEKQMFAFKTRGGDRVALRPEGTPSVMRSYLEHHLGYFSSPLKVFYYGPFFRYEKPQAGRQRQFHQWGVEIIGENDPFYDVETILTALDFLRGLKIKEPFLKINTIGCRVCRPNYKQKLKDYFRFHKSKLCVDCEKRYEKNPLRLLDCKEPECLAIREKAPIILNYLCQACNNHFRSVLELVEDLNISYEPDPYLVRGLDYYSRTVFELFTLQGKGGAIGGGGRYDYLSEQLGGRPIPSVGVALGIERIIEFMKENGLNPVLKSKPKIFFAAVGDQAKKASLKLIAQLRTVGIRVAESVGKKSLKAQLKVANKLKSPLVIILGQKEVFEGTVIIRDMENGAQETILIEKMVEEVKKRLR